MYEMSKNKWMFSTRVVLIYSLCYFSSIYHLPSIENVLSKPLIKVSQKVVHNDKLIITLYKDTVPWLLYTCTAIIWTLMFYVYKAHPCRLIHTVVLNRVGWTLSLGMRLIVKVGQIISIHYVWSSHTCYLKSVKLCILK